MAAMAAWLSCGACAVCRSLSDQVETRFVGSTRRRCIFGFQFCLPPRPAKPTVRKKEAKIFKAFSAALSAAFLSRSSQQLFSAALLSSPSQQPSSAIIFSADLSQQLSAALLSSHPQLWSRVGGQLLGSSCCGHGLAVSY